MAHLKILRSGWGILVTILSFLLSASVPAVAETLTLEERRQLLLRITQPISTETEVNDFSNFSYDYLLGPEDQIGVSVTGFQEFTDTYVVLPDGTVTLPLIGSVPVGGRTVDQAIETITNRLSEFLVDPIVSARLVILKPVVVNVAGEVRRPGPLQVRSVNIANNPAANFRTGTDQVSSIASAIAAVGGITNNADVRRVMLTRPLANGGFTTVEINLWDVIATEKPVKLPLLQDGDSLFIPRLPEGDVEIDRKLLARSSLAPNTVPVQVVGEVNRPGQVQVSPSSSLSAAIAAAGGPTRDARLGKVKVVRLNEAGQVVRETVNAKDLVDGYQIQAGDVVFVPTETFADVLEFAGDLLDPVGNVFQIIRLFDLLGEGDD